MLKVNNKNSKTTSLTLSCVFIVNFEHIVNFEQVDAGWVDFQF